MRGREKLTLAWYNIMSRDLLVQVAFYILTFYVFGKATHEGIQILELTSTVRSTQCVFLGFHFTESYSTLSQQVNTFA